MLKKIIPIIVTASSLFISCSEQKKTPEELVEETPESIEVSTSYNIKYSRGGSWQENIIERLYKEAIEKNIEVSNITKSIQLADEQYSDSLIAYNKYININEGYWETANSYISRISDSVVRKSIKSIFDEAELNYSDSKKDLTHLKDKIILEKERFDNNILLFKLAVTLPMIQNYQNNERPDSLKLKEIITSFENTGNEIKNYNKL